MAVDFATAILIEQMATAGRLPLHELSVEDARALGPAVIEMQGPGPEMFRVENHSIPVEGSEIQLRVLDPKQPTRGVIVWYHGGGWVIGSVNESETLGRKLAERTSCAVVLVEYRMAPEYPYPTPVDDSYAALEWVASNLEQIAGTSDLPLIIGGDSAGGNISAALALRARDRVGPKIALQLLIYPVTDADFERPSYTDPENQLLLNRDGMLWFWDHYCPDAARRTEPDASPLHASDLSGLPAAVVMTAEHDPLRDEGEEYAKRLEEAGVTVDFKRYPGQIHDFFTLLMLPGSELGMQQVSKAVRACIVHHTKGQLAMATR